VSLVVYADFNCVLCYLASWHADLLAGTPEAVDWRAVESQPHLPATGIRLDQAGSEQLEQEWSSARALFSTGSDLPGKPPARVANTGAAVAGYAEAYGAGVADHVRRLLFRAYWVDGADIGDPEVLRRIIAVAIRSGHSTAQPLWESGYAVSMARGPITTGAYYRIRDWQDAAQTRTVQLADRDRRPGQAHHRRRRDHRIGSCDGHAHPTAKRPDRSSGSSLVRSILVLNAARLRDPHRGEPPA